MPKPKRDLFRITANMPIGLLESVDEWSRKKGYSRTTAITILLAQALAAETLKEQKEDN